MMVGCVYCGKRFKKPERTKLPITCWLCKDCIIELKKLEIKK
jgi:hypothetical protein